MARKTTQGKIVEIQVRHTRPGRKWRGTRDSSKHPYKPARMTLWAITDQEHDVWLETRKQLDTSRIEQKVEQYEAENAHRVGEQIEYVLKGPYNEIGFIKR